MGFKKATYNFSQSEYVIRLYDQVRMLSDTPNKADTIDKFSRHFDREIQQAVITQKITTIEVLASLLDTQKHIGPLNASRTPIR